MNKSSIIYLLSIIAILSFCISQIHWLDTRYTYELDRAATSIESKADSIMESYKAFRKESTDTITKVVTKITKDKAHPDKWMCKFNVMSVDAKIPSYSFRIHHWLRMTPMEKSYISMRMRPSRRCMPMYMPML